MTRYLFDTHTFLWLASDDPRLSTRARSLFVDGADDCFLSVASVWEMAIKASLGKLTLATTLERLVQGGVERGLRVLEIAPKHALGVEGLPFHHRDPFDRLLVAQALHEGMHVVSNDDQLDRYAIIRVWS